MSDLALGGDTKLIADSICWYSERGISSGVAQAIRRPWNVRDRPCRSRPILNAPHAFLVSKAIRVLRLRIRDGENVLLYAILRTFGVAGHAHAMIT